MALVIGNSRYEAVGQLPNTTNDAKAIADALKADGFTSVRTALDMTRAGLIAALNDFQARPTRRTRPSSPRRPWARDERHHYLVPIDPRLGDGRGVEEEAVSVDGI